MTPQTTNPKPPAPTPPADVARDLFDALGKRDLDTFASFIAQDNVDDFVVIGEIKGRAAIVSFFKELLAAFPDFDMTVERIVGDHATAVVQWRAEGTFSGGTFQSIEPTNKRVDIRGVDVMDIADGLVQHNTIYYDGASFARQIGLLPNQGSGTDKALLSVFNAATKVRRKISS